MYLVEYNPDYQALVEKYCLSAEQLHYTSEPKEAIALTENDPNRQAVLAFQKDKLVGFLVLHKIDHLTSYSQSENVMLIRSFSTDYRHLGKGYAKKMIHLVTDFVKKTNPHICELLIKVKETDLKNYRIILYENFGFVDTGLKKSTSDGTFAILKLVLTK